MAGKFTRKELDEAYDLIDRIAGEGQLAVFDREGDCCHFLLAFGRRTEDDAAPTIFIKCEEKGQPFGPDVH